jgi:hypothetical protein
MTMPFERTRAVLQTRDFLQWVLSAEATSEMFKQAKRQARTLLRHYPSSIDLHLAHLACPMWFGATLERKRPMPPDEVERLVADLDSAEHDGQDESPQGAGGAPPQRFSNVKQFDVREWAKRKGVKLPKR